MPSRPSYILRTRRWRVLALTIFCLHPLNETARTDIVCPAQSAQSHLPWLTGTSAGVGYSGVFFRISNMGVSTNPWGSLPSLTLPPLPSPFPFSYSSLPCQFPLRASSPPILHPLPSPPSEVGPLNPDRGLGSNLVHFSLEIWRLVATNLMIILRIR